MIELADKVETIHQLETHLSKYRKSYKICRSAHLSLQILAGTLGCGAVLALVPAVPIFVAIAGALPAGISIVVSKAQFKEKENLYIKLPSHVPSHLQATPSRSPNELCRCKRNN